MIAYDGVAHLGEHETTWSIRGALAVGLHLQMEAGWWQSLTLDPGMFWHVSLLLETVDGLSRRLVEVSAT